MRSLPRVTELVRACGGLDAAGSPWDVDEVYTKTQYLLGELGRSRLVRESHTETQGVYRINTGEYKAESPTYEP